MIAHRLKTIKYRSVLVLRWRNSRTGSHEELIKNNGLYSDLINVQKLRQSWK